jgi:anaerobic magnesium-protoporphyrin IX monomethyl ester cyclase
MRKAIMNNETNIALISLYSTDAIGLRYLKAALSQRGHDVPLIYFKEKHLASDLMSPPTEQEFKLLMDVLRERKPKIVGISLRSSFFRIACSITERIQRELSVPVMWGGTHPTVAPEESINVADMICIGEGEAPLLDLADKLSSSQDFSHIPNLWVRRNGEIIQNEVGPLSQDLDALPFPSYGGSDNYFIENNALSPEDPGLQTYNLNIMASRGCPYHCSYCCNSVFKSLYKGKGRRVRRRSVENVMDEIHSLRDKFSNVKRIDFIDEVFAWDKEWTRRFTERYKKEVGLPFQCAQHPNMVDKDILVMLKDAGLERVEVGVQSGSERIRKGYFERPVPNAKLQQTARFLKEMRIVPFYDFIVDNPFETEEDKRDGLEFLLSFPRPFHLHVFSLIYFPSTVITRRALEAGLISENQIEGRAEQTFDQMFVTLKYPRPKNDQFWISLYSMASKSFLPKTLIRWLSRRTFLREHPEPLVIFADFANTFKLGLIAIKWLLEGKPVFSTIRQTAKRGASPIV